jgi:hypothetical protein
MIVVTVAAPETERFMSEPIAAQFNSRQILPSPAVNKDALPGSPANIAPAASSHSACQNKHRFLA